MGEQKLEKFLNKMADLSTEYQQVHTLYLSKITKREYQNIGQELSLAITKFEVQASVAHKGLEEARSAERKLLSDEKDLEGSINYYREKISTARQEICTLENQMSSNKEEECKLKRKLKSNEDDLEELRDEREKALKNCDTAAKVSLASDAVAVATGIGGIFFPPLWLATIASSGSALVSVGVCAGEKIDSNRLLKTIEELKEEIRARRNRIKSIQKELDSQQEKLDKLQGDKNRASDRVDECRKELKCNKKFQEVAVTWERILNEWKSILHRLIRPLENLKKNYDPADEDNPFLQNSHKLLVEMSWSEFIKTMNEAKNKVEELRKEYPSIDAGIFSKFTFLSMIKKPSIGY